MPEYWYIWFEIFDDGKKVGEGRYPRSYRRRRNAERRAIQMWGREIYSPVGNTTLKRKWTVSETCPWEK